MPRIFLPLLLLVNCAAQADTFDASVIAVMDGDTVYAQSGGFKAKIRLLNIDAPEKDQAYGKQSTESLRSLIGGKVVKIESRAVDKFGRTLALISVGGINVNQEQVKRGMAWAYSRSREGKIYVGLQSEAQLAKRGLWREANPQQPSQWRKLHPTQYAGHSPSHAAKPSSQTQDASKFGVLECGKKYYCSQMVTCDEAHFYLTVCGLERLDTNKDGIPCENLCLPTEKIRR